ncbi:MAG: hypothetical protein AAF824_22570 [Bacteroidota bacterium]
MDAYIFKPTRHYAWEKGLVILLGLGIWIWIWTVNVQNQVKPVENETNTEQNEPNSWKVEKGRIYNV